MNHRRLRPVTLPLATLLLFNSLQLLYPLPVFLQLLLNATLTIHLGCILSVTLGRASYKQIRECEDQLKASAQPHQNWLHAWQILKYPLLGCLVLLTLYFLIKNTDAFTINTILDFIFVCATTYYASTRLHNLFLDPLRDFAKAVALPEKHHPLLETLSKYALCPAFVGLLCLLFVARRNWLLNNLFALFFAVSTLKQTSIKSFKLAVPILWTLFLYDLYWVYQSDVMVTVAKTIDLPLKLLFPYLDNQQLKFSILGLGDIIVPGLFLSLCLKYDVDNCILSINRPKTMEDFRLPLYYVTLALYVLGVVLTYTAMAVFQHAQPALVFIVPSLTLSLLANQWLERRLPMASYSTDVMTKADATQVI